MNSTIVYLWLEILGRENIPGRINVYGPELKALPVPNPNLFDDAAERRVLELFGTLSRRKIRKILDEVNQADRRAFDEVIFDTLGLTEEERRDIYEALVTLVQRRLLKEQSVKKSKRKMD